MCLSFLGSYMAICWLFYPDPGLAIISLSIGAAVGHSLVPLFLDACMSNYGLHGCLLLCAGLTLQCAPSGLVLHSLRQCFVTEDKTEGADKQSSPTKCSMYKLLFSDVVILLILLNAFLMVFSGTYFTDLSYTFSH